MPASLLADCLAPKASICNGEMAPSEDEEIAAEHRTLCICTNSRASIITGSDTSSNSDWHEKLGWQAAGFALHMNKMIVQLCCAPSGLQGMVGSPKATTLTYEPIIATFATRLCACSKPNEFETTPFLDCKVSLSGSLRQGLQSATYLDWVVAPPNSCKYFV